MQAIPVSFPNPFDWANLWFQEYGRHSEFLYQRWIGLLRQVGSARLSPQDIALDRINRMQILLYRGYVRRQRMKVIRSREWEMQRFTQWMCRYSGNFRRLVDLYPEWLAEFDNQSYPRARLMRTIAFHLYQ